MKTQHLYWLLGACLGTPLFLFNFGIRAQNPKATPATRIEILLADRWPVPTPVTKEQNRLTFRGLGLESIEIVEAIPKTGPATPQKPIPLKIVKKEKSGPPANRDSTQGGDSQLELELPVGISGISSLRFASREKAGELVIPWLETGIPFEMDKEPNGGFVQSQPIHSNQLILGNIIPVKDVDVFSLNPPKGSKNLVLTGPKGNKLTLLRPFLMIHTAQGNLLKAQEWDGDKEIVVPLTDQSNYFLSIIDTLDSSSNFHHYAFRVEFR